MYTKLQHGAWLCFPFVSQFWFWRGDWQLGQTCQNVVIE